jgi:3-oxoacyl-(acyl-carrier-protein) synthase
VTGVQTCALPIYSQGATGVHEAIYSLLMMQNGFICESANIEELDPAFADMPIVLKRIDNVRLGAVRCMQMALVPVKPPVDYINPHATSTPIGDLREIEAIREVFGAKCPPIAATKSLTGHSLGAAGAQEAIYSLLMMNNGFICESANIDNLDPAFTDMPIVRERRDGMRLGCVLSNSFGFGGTNACVVFKRLDA